jgi:hypothetical protein
MAGEIINFKNFTGLKYFMKYFVKYFSDQKFHENLHHYIYIAFIIRNNLNV